MSTHRLSADLLGVVVAAGSQAAPRVTLEAQYAAVETAAVPHLSGFKRSVGLEVSEPLRLILLGRGRRDQGVGGGEGCRSGWGAGGCGGSGVGCAVADAREEDVNASSGEGDHCCQVPG